VSAMAKYGVKPSLSQAVRLKKMSQSEGLIAQVIDAILSEDKKPIKQEKETSRYSKFFPKSYTPGQIEKVIIGLLSAWQAKFKGQTSE